VTMNTFIYKKLPYDPVRDFVPITQTVANPMGAVVNPASGIKSIKDIVERAKANPGQLNYGSVGHGKHTPSDGRDAVDCGRYPDDACALPGADAGDHRRPERTDSARVHDD